ncbi:MULTISPECIES: SPOR domain-containing protein [unclassified Carboxylicivirga]|uniref:HU domain-containing protein n=1 Tax=Carboxylicivirga TaxID=1628153 RepID=UPI003D34BC1E
MTTVAQHISNLLYTHECVIIPHLGALVSTTVSARIDTETNRFMPPSREIGFNRSLSHNDGLLISTLSQINGLSYEAARQSVDAFVNDLTARIDRGEVGRIDKVGSLKKDALGSLQFVADSSEAYLPEAFGLSSFHFTPHVTPQKLVSENRQVRRLLQPVGLRQIAATVAMVVGLFAISQSLDNPLRQHKVNAASTMPLIWPASSAIETSPVEVETTSVSTAVVEEEAPAAENIYYLIAGSFKTENQASRFLRIVHEMGEEQAFVLASPNNRYRVAINGYSDKANAVKELNAYRGKEGFKTVWVLTQR